MTASNFVRNVIGILWHFHVLKTLTIPELISSKCLIFKLKFFGPLEYKIHLDLLQLHKWIVANNLYLLFVNEFKAAKWAQRGAKIVLFEDHHWNFTRLLPIDLFFRAIIGRSVPLYLLYLLYLSVKNVCSLALTLKGL